MIFKKDKMVLPKITLYKLFLPLFLFSFTSVIFAESTYNKTIYTAFVSGDMTKWDHVIRTMEASNSTITVDQKLELINYYYGYIGYLIGKKQFEPAEKLISKGEKLINQVLRVSPKNATAYSFKGSYLGFQIGICKYKAVFLGSDSKSFINKSLEIDPQNVQGLIDKGNLLYYSPKLFGGDKKEALVFFLKAVKVMEQKKETNENWVYLNLLSIIASSYEKTDNLAEARITYEKIIRNEPEIKWIKDKLYPQLLAKIKS